MSKYLSPKWCFINLDFQTHSEVYELLFRLSAFVVSFSNHEFVNFCAKRIDHILADMVFRKKICQKIRLDTLKVISNNHDKKNN